MSSLKPVDYIPITLGILCVLLTRFFPDVKDMLLLISGFLGGWGGLARPSVMFGRGGTTPPTTPLAPVILLFGVLLTAGTARADAANPVTGGCLSENPDKTCKVTYLLSMPVPILVVDLNTGDPLVGAAAVSLGPCYGLTFQPERWYAYGADICTSVAISNQSPNSYRGSLMLHFTPLGSVGIGEQGQQIDGKMVWHTLLLFAPRVPVQ
jgi:hypothetical protein